MIEELTPTDYFNKVKASKTTITDTDLVKYYDVCLELAKKYTITKQTKALKKLIFTMETITKERELVKLGFNQFVYREEIESFIETIGRQVVKIIDLPSYDREIPDSAVQKLQSLEHISADYYVLFTDYTGKTEKKVAKEKRDKDPILFLVFKNAEELAERFYFIEDWEDEYCDITLGKLVEVMGKEYEVNPVHEIGTPTSLEEVKAELEKLDGDHKLKLQRLTEELETNVDKKTLWEKIKGFFRSK